MAKYPVARGFGGWKGFGLGIAASMLVEAVAPELLKSTGPAVRSVLKFGFRIADQLGRSAARTREQVEDFVADVRAEYDAEQRGESAPPAPPEPGLGGVSDAKSKPPEG